MRASAVPVAFALVIAPISATAEQVTTERTKLDCSKGFEVLLENARAKSSAVDDNPSDWIIIEVEDGLQIYSFTKSSHYAHPAIVLRTIVEKDKTFALDMTGCGYGEKEKFNKVMREFEVLNEQMREAIKSDHGK
jgi:hypothetical protein